MYVYARARILMCALIFATSACAAHRGAIASLIPEQPQLAALQPPSLVDQRASTSLVMATGTQIGLFQVFDEFSDNLITSPQAVSDGPRYALTWGSREGMPTSWRAKNNAMAVTYYMPQETDAATGAFGYIGHSLEWWKLNHPSWILYACEPNGTPTTTPAYIPQLPDYVPLDIHNPQVVDYQIRLAATYAREHGYSALGFDEVLFSNVTGSAVGSGYYGCGVYQSGKFLRRYASKTDAAWENDTVSWVKAAHALLRTDATLAPMDLKFVVNHPASNPSSPSEQAVLQNVDADLDETGFSDYGSYKKTTAAGLFGVTVNWMAFAQAHGAAPLIVDKFDQTTPVTSEQLEYSIATYLAGNQGTARLFVTDEMGYGREQYHAEYASNFGTPCAAMYGGRSYDALNPNIYYRRYTNALVVVNAGSLPRSSEVAHLPAGHVYADLERRPVSNPLAVASSDAYVLFTTNGCQ